MNHCRIHFLEHSGFVLETEEKLLVFDYYMDRTDVLGNLLKDTGKKLYFLVSHCHYDHFNPAIRRFENRCSGYFIHSDCDLKLERKDILHRMQVGDRAGIDGMEIKMYGSTDEGGSFLIESSELTVFHAGDLNWWHWAGESDAENTEARCQFFEELGKIRETAVDILFFPVDERQQIAKEWGVKAALNHFKAGLLVPMHSFGKIWVPSYEFRWTFPTQKIWIPGCNGDAWEGV